MPRSYNAAGPEIPPVLAGESLPDALEVIPVEPSDASLFDLEQIRSIPIAERKNLVRAADFGHLLEPDAPISSLLESLPRILAAAELRRAVSYTADAVVGSRQVMAAMGGHVVKVGMAPVIIDLMRRGVVTTLVMNGSTAIHDYEIGLIGETSEDVATNIADGSFGLARETAAAFGTAAHRAVVQERGLGWALGQELLDVGAPHREVSMLAQAAELDVPVTVHVALGTDVVHMHPEIDGGEMGAASYHDFRLLASRVTRLGDGVWLNIGSAVVLPEVFLKVINMARNVGHALAGVTAINFDMLQHYRTSVNVLRRPVERGISLIGHHEIMLPLFRLTLLAELQSRGFGKADPA